METINAELEDSLHQIYKYREFVISKAHSTYSLKAEGLNLAGYIENISDTRVAVLDDFLVDESKRSRGIALKALKTLEGKLKTMNVKYIFAYFDKSQTVQFLLTCGFIRIDPKEFEKENINLSKYLRGNLSFKTLLSKELK